MTPLAQSIDLLYEAFSEVRRPARIDACPCCLDEKEIATLLARPLRSISGPELSSYASAAFLTVGATADYLYFLPRILEISMTDRSWWPDPEITGRAIANTSPAEWPVARRRALEHTLEAYFEHLIAAPDLGWRIDQWMCAAARMTLDVAPYLAIVQRSPTHVKEFYEANSRALLKKNKLGNAFWDEPTQGYDQIVRWFRSDEVVAILA